MTLRCKVGDIAVITTGIQAGLLLEVLAACPWREACWEVKQLSQNPQAIRLVDGNWTLYPVTPGAAVFCYDEILRPIRDGNGEDEALRRVGKPNETLEDLYALMQPKRQTEFAR